MPTTVLDVEGEELPLAAARNRAADLAQGRHLVFLDVDCVPHPGLFAEYRSALADRDAVVIGRTRYEPDEPDGEFRVPHSERFRSRFEEGGEYEEFWSLNFAIRRATFWESLRGFDEGFSGYGFEDTDFAFEAAEIHLPLLWARDAVATHLHHPPSRLEPERLPALVANAKLFRRKWGRWPAQGWLRELGGLGLVDWRPERDRLEVS